MTTDQRKESIVIITDDATDVSGKSRRLSVKPQAAGAAGRRKSTFLKLSNTATTLTARRLTKALLELPEDRDSLLNKPKVRMENTYKMKPDEGFVFMPHRVRDEVNKVFKEHLEGVSYDINTTGKLCCELAQTIRNRVRYLEFPRYKLVCNVIIGQCADQGLEVASRCLWDSKTDNSACVQYKNKSLFAIATIHGIFFE